MRRLKNRAGELLAQADEDLEAGRITEAEWFSRVAEVLTPAYLAATDPRAQSGHGGDETRWTRARSLVLDGVHRCGSFLDVGCANGYLMESLDRWAAARGLRLDLYGVDIAPELVALARRRLPAWRDRFFTGNALYWRPERTFDFVRTGLEYVPRSRLAAYVRHLWEACLAPGGRLLVGTFNEEVGLRATESLLESLGYTVTGRSERDHRDPRLRYRVVWLDRSAAP